MNKKHALDKKKYSGLEMIVAVALAMILTLAGARALGQETGPAGSVMRVPAAGGKARMGPLDLSSANATENRLNATTKLSGLTAGSCLFGAPTTGYILQPSTSNCFWDSVNYQMMISGGVGIGATLPANSMFKVTSTTKSSRPQPAMSTAQRDAISSPAAGDQVYNTDTNQLNVYNGSAWVSVGSGAGGDGGINLLAVQNLNPDFENGYNSSWTNSGGTWAAASGTDILFDLVSTAFTASGSGQWVRSALATVTYGTENRPCIGQVYYKGGDANLVLKVLDASSTLIASRTFTATTVATPLAVPFQCGAVGTQYRLSIESTAAAAKVALDRARIGEHGFPFIDAVPFAVTKYTTGGATGTFTTNSNTRYIRVKMVGGGGGGGGTNAGAAGTGGGTTFFGTSFLTATGGAGGGPSSSSAGGIGGVATMNAGATGVAADGSNGNNAGSTATNVNQFGGMGGVSPFGGNGAGGAPGSNATVAAKANTGSGGGGAGGAAAGYAPGGGGGAGAYIDALIVAPLTSYAYQVGTGGAGGTGSLVGSSGAAGVIIVEEYGYASGSAINAETSGWRVDANITGTTSPSMSVSSQASYVGIEATDQTLVNNTGMGVLPAMIPCSSTNAPTGTNCAVGSESLGVSFVVPYAGDVRACASFSHIINSNAGADVNVTFQLVETAANAQTVIQEGKSRINSRSSMTSSAQLIHIPQRICGNFTFSSAGQKTIRLMYEQLVTGTIGSNQIATDQLSTLGQRDMHWEVYPINQSYPMPVFFDFTQAKYDITYRQKTPLLNGGQYEATVSMNGASSAIIRQTGTWIGSMSNNSSNDQTITFTGTPFANIPYCTCTSMFAGTSGYMCTIHSVSTGSVRIQTFDHANAAAFGASFYANLRCSGN